MSGYTWAEYDPREGGVQVINDAPNNVKITTEFLKVPGGAYGGSWAARVKGEPLTPGTYPAFIINRRPLNDAVQKVGRHVFLLYSTSDWRVSAGWRWRRRSKRTFVAVRWSRTA